MGAEISFFAIHPIVGTVATALGVWAIFQSGNNEPKTAFTLTILSFIIVCILIVADIAIWANTLAHSDDE